MQKRIILPDPGKIGLRKKFRKKEQLEDSKMNQNKKQNQSYENSHTETYEEPAKTEKPQEEKHC